jgi:hypothetical protein
MNAGTGGHDHLEVLLVGPLGVLRHDVGYSCNLFSNNFDILRSGDVEVQPGATQNSQPIRLMMSIGCGEGLCTLHFASASTTLSA